MLRLQRREKMLKFVFKNYIVLTICILILSGHVKVTEGYDALQETVCKSVTIRSVHDFNQLQNCTLMVGYVRIVEMDFSAKSDEEIKPSRIEEINEYLLVYRVTGLDSLEKLFPLLTFIRGSELLFDTYALTIMENRDLENIGLVSLVRVLSGALRIESNPLLCYIHTIDWMAILGFSSSTNIHISNNRSPNQCPLCYLRDGKTKEDYIHRGCWSYKKFQVHLDSIRGEVCPKSRCLSECGENFCKTCTDFLLEKEGCTNYCHAFEFKLAFKRQCVRNCTQYGLLEHGFNCIEKCPKYQETFNNEGTLYCVANCTGDFVINNIKDLEDLEYCSTIKGSVTIEIHEMEKPIVEYLESAFRNVIEITGYLKVVNSPQITSLYFFDNLEKIGGQQLIENKYALYVVDNTYLENLFLIHVAILNGCVYIHLNPGLCVHKLRSLQYNVKECLVTVLDVSEYSNGERALCNTEGAHSSASIVDYNSTAALIEVSLLPANNLILVLGYVYFYKESPAWDIEDFEGRHGCGKDDWFTDVVLTRRRHHIIKDLKPATRYAYFTYTLTMTDYSYYLQHESEIRYFRTLPAKPSAVEKLYAVSRSGTQMDLHWWPPLLQNGLIEKYILNYETINVTEPKEDLLPNPHTEVCQCPKLNNESHVSTPHIEEFYKKEKSRYRDVLLNFLFLSKRAVNFTKLTRNKSDPEYAAIITSRYKMLMLRLQEEAFKKQEEQTESYVIEHTKPICEHREPSQENGTKIACEPLEMFKNIVEISGFRHSVAITNLEPGKTYRFSIRACVKGLANGCGPEKVLLAATFSKQITSTLARINQKK